jgi:hypothetical protein
VGHAAAAETLHSAHEYGTARDEEVNVEVYLLRIIYYYYFIFTIV